MIKITNFLLIVFVLGSIGGCASDGVDSNFEYENLTDTIKGTPFRDRRYDYARQVVVEAPPLKIPIGLNGEQIEPRFVMPDGENDYAASQVNEAEELMLPPDFDKTYNIIAVTKEQISKLSISVTYDSNSNIKLIFREPLVKTQALVVEYLKDNTTKYEMLSEQDKMMTGHLIRVKDISTGLVFIIKIRSIDALSSLVSITAVFSDNGDIAENKLSEQTAFLTTMRKELNGKDVDTSDLTIVNTTSSADKKSSGGMSGLANSLSSISFGSYGQSVKKKDSGSGAQVEPLNETSTMPIVSDNDDVYDSASQAEEINT